MSDPETVDVKCIVERRTELAYKLRQYDGEEDPKVAWFPASEIVFKQRNIRTGIALAETPLWLFKAKGWDS
jgi:hypothetical protein